MNGLLLDDESVLNAMEPGLKGIYIPVKATKNGYSGSLATLAELGKIKSHIDSLLIDMANELSGGKISAMPYRKNGELSCGFCPYKAICRRSEDSPFVEHESFKNEEFYRYLEGSDDNG